MNFKQFLKLNEMYVKENGKEYFLIPATIDNIKKCKTIKDVIKRNIAISEFYGCFCHMLEHYLKTKSGFYISNRSKNSKTLAKLGIDIDEPYGILKESFFKRLAMFNKSIDIDIYKNPQSFHLEDFDIQQRYFSKIAFFLSDAVAIISFASAISVNMND